MSRKGSEGKSGVTKGHNCVNFVLFITCLTVNPENALETLGDTVQLRPVVELDELVVLHPGGQLGKAQVIPVLH